MNEAQNKKLLLIDPAGSELLTNEERETLNPGQWHLVLNKDYSQLPLAYSDQSWDAVIWRLENITNIKAILLEVFRIIALGGRAILIGNFSTQKKSSCISFAKSFAEEVRFLDLIDGRCLISFDKSQLFDSGSVLHNTTLSTSREKNIPSKTNKANAKNSNLLSTDIASAVGGYFGCVDSITEAGIFGWLINTENLNDPIPVSIFLEDELIGSAYTVVFRSDISKAVERPVNCGFHFKWKKAILPADVKKQNSEEEAKLRFVIESEGLQLPVLELLPTIGDLRIWVGTGEVQLLSGSQKKALIKAFEGQDVEPEISLDVKAIAFYLPQFHPIPENDEWWGAGFTEWTNVSQAKPLFPGHYQPHIPADLGYYDLRLPELREAQAEMARNYGIHGFCYYYYWFAGRRILERPLQEVLESGEPDFPFCICWANETWSRRWDGSEQDILIKQEHTFENDVQFIHDVIPIFRDPRYIKISGAPILLIYRLDLFPDPVKTAGIWRQICRDVGIGEIHLCAVESFGFSEPIQMGFDSSVEFPPHKVVAADIKDEIEELDKGFTGCIYDYEEVVVREINKESPPYKRFRSVMCSWDNTARKKKNSNLFANATTETYEIWLRDAVDKTKAELDPGERFVFINAWNEWAEGTHLEPDLKHGKEYLEATRRALTGSSNWRELVSYAKKKEFIDKEALNKLLEELETHLLKYDRSLEILSKIHRYAAHQAFSRTIFKAEIPHQISVSPIEGGIGHLDRVNQLSVGNNALYALSRDRLAYISGWAIGQNVHNSVESTTYLILETTGSKLRYYGLLCGRTIRDDIAQSFPDRPQSETLYSGFSTYIDVSNVLPAQYRLGVLQFSDGVNLIKFFNGVVEIV